MAVNFSSPSLNYYQNCTNSWVAVSMVISFIFIKCFLVVPLSLLVLYLGLQRWRQQGFSATTSHSDIITYHSAAVGLIYALGIAIYTCGLFFGVLQVIALGYYLWSVAIPVETSFHILTCVDRYLAVAHPVLYLGLRHSRGVWIRNISIGCVWLLCFGWMGLDGSFYSDFSHIPYFCFLILSLVVVSFCSLSVLCALIRPGPGEIGRDRVRVDQSKQKAFYTITTILGVLWLCLTGYFVIFALAKSHVMNYTDECFILMFGYWCSLPSSLILFVLFLQRSRKMLSCLQ